MAAGGQTLANRLRGKGGLIAVVLIILLGLLIWKDQGRTPPPPPGKNPPVSEYVGLRSDEVEEISIKRPTGVLALARHGDDWVLTRPIQADADATKVNEMLKELLDIGVATQTGVTLAQVADRLADYGLAKPAAVVTLKGRGKTHVIQVGGPAPGGGSESFAVETGDGRLFTIATYKANDLKKKKAADYRQMSLLRIKGDQLTDVQIVQGSEVTELKRDSKGDWQMLRPVAAEVDRPEVSSVVSALQNLQAEKFVVEQTDDPAKYGLDKPRLKITVTDKRGAHTVSFGKSFGKDGQVYAQRAGDPAVAVIAKYSFTDLNKGYGKLRNRIVMDFDSDDVTKFEITNAHGSMAFEKQGGDWRLIKPIQAKANGTAVEDLLITLSEPSNAAIEENCRDLAKYGLDKPKATVVVWTKDGNSQTLFVGKKSPLPGYYVRSSGTQVFEVLEQTVAQIQVKPTELKAKPAGDAANS